MYACFLYSSSLIYCYTYIISVQPSERLSGKHIPTCKIKAKVLRPKITALVDYTYKIILVNQGQFKVLIKDLNQWLSLMTH